jgi:hypothetical protein
MRGLAGRRAGNDHHGAHDPRVTSAALSAPERRAVLVMIGALGALVALALGAGPMVAAG